VIFAGSSGYTFFQVDKLRQRQPAGWKALGMLGVFVLSSQLGVGQAPPAGNLPPVMIASLPDAPMFSDVDTVRSGANGAPEYSNAIPQVKQSIEDQSDDQESPAFFNNHLIRDRFWISGQSNFILQAHEPFHSPYSGPNSFRASGEAVVSRTVTLYTGVRLLRFTELVANFDEAGGRGLSDTLGVAAYVNADATDPTVGRSVYLSRTFIHHTVALTADRIDEDPNPFYLQPSIPRRRLEFTFGKMSLLDFFDVNEVGSDTHLQFTNLAIGNNGIYEVPGDTHGFTVAAMATYQGPKIGFRFAEALLPKFTSSGGLDYNVRHVHSDNFQFDYSTYTLQSYATHLRLLAFVNHADLGNYHEANDAYLKGQDPVPDITAHRHPDTTKPGFGVNFEQELPANFRVYFRAGWNDGNYESFIFSEMNHTVSFGVDLSGDGWHRKLDRIGSAFVTSGLSQDHREYLALGGLGFMLGDGDLTYGRESVSETYYTAHVIGGLYVAPLLSFVNNPGFNKDRGPVVVPGFRAHLDF
jgi:high affinity Mn2+ porin